MNEGTTERRLIYELGNRQWDIPELRLMLTDIVTSGAQFQGYELSYDSVEVGQKLLSLNARRVIRQQDSILLAIEDITERRRSQQLLAEREAWFHQIANNAPTLIWVTDAEGHYTFLNKVWLDYTGRSMKDVAEFGWLESLHPDDQPVYQVKYNRHVKSRQPFSIEYRLHRRDGEYRWMLENAQPMFASDGTFTGYIGSSADVHLQHEMNHELDQRVRQRTEELAHSNDLMRIALNASQAGLGQWDWQNNLAVWDDRANEIIGFTNPQETVSIDGWLSRIHPDDRERFRAHVQECLQTGRNFWMEYRVVHDDGSLHYVLGTGQMKLNEESKSLHSSGLVIDITSIKLAEQELRQRTNQLSTLVENTPDAIARWDTNRQLLFANNAFVTKMEQPLETLLGKTASVMNMPAEIAAAYMAKLQQVFDTGQSQEHYNALPTKKGLLQFYSRMVPERGPDGTIESVLTIARDITDLQEAEHNLQQSAQNLQTVLNSSPAAIGFLKPLNGNDQPITDFRVVVANKVFARIAGQSIDQLSGWLASSLSSGLWHEHTIETIRHVMDTGEPFREERWDEASGQWILITLTKYNHGVVLVGQDITALKQAEQQQEHLLDELEKSNQNIQALTLLRQQLRERGAFLRSTSHDLRGNFGIIQGAATLLDFAKSEEERAQMLSMLQRNLQQATKMLTELLDIARLESGQEERQIAQFDVTELLNGMVESTRPLAIERGLWLRLEGPETFSVESDAVKIRRIVQNLLLNSIKYTPTGGITVSWGEAAEPDRWLLTIADTGPGLPDETHTTTGEGIGLLIVQQLCELLDCQTSITNEAGGGTQFRLLFPRSYPDALGGNPPA